MIKIEDHKLLSLLPPKATNTKQLRQSKIFPVQQLVIKSAALDISDT